MGISTRHPRQQLLAFVEGGLDPIEHDLVRRHVADCAACRAEVAELIHVNVTLLALPAALRRLSSRPADSWAVIWARVQDGPVRRLAPQLNLYLSLAVIVFVLSAALPAGLGVQPVSVTAGAAQTPIAALVTPTAGQTTAANAAQMSTALAAYRLTPGARAVPVPTPVPDLKG